MVTSPIAKTYDPAAVIVTFCGVPLSGFADGTFVKVTAKSDRYAKKIGADGEVARVRQNDDTSEVEVILMQTSFSNTFLSAQLELDRTANIGAGPLSITDINGGTLFFWPQAWIKKVPDVEYSKDISARAWAFDTGQVANEMVNGDFPTI